MSYGIAGSNPLALPTVTIESLLKDAIKARWDADYTTPLGLTFPLSSDILWLNTWYVGVKEAELIFLHGFLDPFPATTDHRYERDIQTVDCHIWVKGVGGDVEPPTLVKVLNGLQTVIAKNKATLIPNANVRIASSQRAPTDKDDTFKSLWHYLVKIRVTYYTVSTT